MEQCPDIYGGHAQCIYTKGHPGWHRFERDGQHWDWDDNKALKDAGLLTGWSPIPPEEWR